MATLTIARAYHRALERLQRARGDGSHEGDLRELAGHVRVAASDGPLHVAVWVTTAHVIERARYQRARSEEERLILEGLCRQLEGLPITEAADHGVLRLEHALRDPMAPRPVAGIVMPMNADPSFRPLVRLVRELLAAYRAATGYRETTNDFDPPLSAQWLALEPTQAKARIQGVLSAAPLGDGVSVLEIQNRRRVVVALADTDAKAKQARLIGIERLLKERVEPGLEVVQKPRRDDMVLRVRLAGGGG